MKRIYAPALWLSFRAMLKQQFLILARYPVNLVTNFLLVLVIVIVITLVVTLFAPVESATRLRGITLYGFVIYIFLSHTIWAVGLGLQKEKMDGTLTSLYLTPASRFLTLLARSLVALSWTGVAGLSGLLIAQAVTGPILFDQPWLALGILLFTVSGLIGLGFAIAGVALHFGDSIEMVANFFEFTLMGLCAFFFPFAVLPSELQTISGLIPLSYSVDAFRTVSLGETHPELLPLQAELAIIVGTGTLAPLLGYAVYLVSEKKARVRGTL